MLLDAFDAPKNVYAGVETDVYLPWELAHGHDEILVPARTHAILHSVTWTYSWIAHARVVRLRNRKKKVTENVWDALRYGQRYGAVVDVE
jgi:hypothetical protein